MNTTQTITNTAILLIGTVVLLIWGYFIFNDLQTNGWPLEILITMLTAAVIALIAEAVISSTKDDRIGSFNKRPTPRYGIKANMIRFPVLFLSVIVEIIFLGFLGEIQNIDYRILFIGATIGFSQLIVYFVFFFRYAQKIDFAIVTQAEQQRQEQELKQKYHQLLVARQTNPIEEKRKEYDPEKDVGEC